MRMFKCDRCGESMKQATDATIRIKGARDVSYHACEDCANEIALIAAGNKE